MGVENKSLPIPFYLYKDIRTWAVSKIVESGCNFESERLKSISYAKYLCLIIGDCFIFFYIIFRWICVEPPVGAQLKQISVNSAGIWAVDTLGRINVRKEVKSTFPEGTHWQNIVVDPPILSK